MYENGRTKSHRLWCVPCSKEGLENRSIIGSTRNRSHDGRRLYLAPPAEPDQRDEKKVQSGVAFELSRRPWTDDRPSFSSTILIPLVIMRSVQLPTPLLTTFCGLRYCLLEHRVSCSLFLALLFLSCKFSISPYAKCSKVWRPRVRI